jgi:hypothetical protein
MKNILLFSLLLSVSYGFAAKTDSLFQRHQLSFSMTNGVSVVPLSQIQLFGSFDSEKLRSPRSPPASVSHGWPLANIYKRHPEFLILHNVRI